jgi:hypothetical protein
VSGADPLLHRSGSADSREAAKDQKRVYASLTPEAIESWHRR